MSGNNFKNVNWYFYFAVKRYLKAKSNLQFVIQSNNDSGAVFFTAT